MLIKYDKLGYNRILELLVTIKQMSDCQRHGVAILGCEILFDYINVKTISINSPLIGKCCTGELGKCGCRHAEELLALEGQFELIIATHSPCAKCYVEFLDPSKIREYWYVEKYRAGLKHTKDSIFPLVEMSDYDTVAKRWNALRKHK